MLPQGTRKPIPLQLNTMWENGVGKQCFSSGMTRITSVSKKTTDPKSWNYPHINGKNQHKEIRENTDEISNFN